MPEELDYAPRIVLPTEGELSPSEINQLISTATTLRKIDQESKAAARRYRGQQQLQTLIQQGVPMEKAMMQVSGDLFYQKPEHLTPMLRQFEIDRRTEERQRAADARFQQLMNFRERQAALKVPPLPKPSPEQTGKARILTAGITSTQNQIAHTIAQDGDPETLDRLQKHLAKLTMDLNEVYHPPEMHGYEPEVDQDVPPSVNPAYVYDKALSGTDLGLPPVGPAVPTPPTAGVKRWKFNPTTGKIEPQ